MDSIPREMSVNHDGQPNSRQPLIFSEIEELRRAGYNQTEIAKLHGVTRQAVSWQKRTYGGAETPRQVVNASWPWETTHAHSCTKTFQNLRSHGEFMLTGGRGMSEDKRSRLEAWWRKMRRENLVLEFDPNLPPEKGVSSVGGFAYRPRQVSDGSLLIRVNELTTLTERGRAIWCWPSEDAPEG